MFERRSDLMPQSVIILGAIVLLAFWAPLSKWLMGEKYDGQ